MIVILLKDLNGTGKKGDVVKVSDGYARNMLLPKGIAKEATEGNVKNLNKQKEIAAEKEAEKKAAAQELAKKMEDMTVTIEAKGGEGGRLFGSITTKDISEALAAQHKIKVDKKKMDLKTAIKNAGEFHVKVKLYPEVAAELKVIVTVA